MVNAPAALIGYEIPDNPEPIPEDMPTMFVPMQELENLAASSWYINVLAALPQFRRRGLGTRLLALADEMAESSGKRRLSVIVSDANTGARRLYERCGYNERAMKPIVKETWKNEGQSWVLLTKDL
jgi:ribosomal protein S18 acetylase RimI-like enzyme